MGHPLPMDTATFVDGTMPIFVGGELRDQLTSPTSTPGYDGHGVRHPRRADPFNTTVEDRSLQRELHDEMAPNRRMLVPRRARYSVFTPSVTTHERAAIKTGAARSVPNP